MRGTWVSPLPEPWSREKYGDISQGRYQEDVQENWAWGVLPPLPFQEPVPRVGNGAPRPLYRRTRTLGALLLGDTDSLEGPYPVPPGLRGGALQSMVAWKPEDWGSQILWHSLTRNWDEDCRRWARTREVWGTEGEEGLA